MRPLLIAALLLLAPALAGCTTSGSGNLALHVTDAPGNIDDFSVLNVTVEKIVLTAKDGRDQEHAPASGTFDLTKLTSGNVTTIFNGSIPSGNYTKMTLHVKDAKGVLKANGAEVDVKAPSGRLFVTTQFEIAEGKTTDFLFDIEVHRQGNGDYLFQPNATASGPGKKGGATAPATDDGKGK